MNFFREKKIFVHIFAFVRNLEETARISDVSDYVRGQSLECFISYVLISSSSVMILIISTYCLVISILECNWKNLSCGYCTFLINISGVFYLK